MNNQYINKFDKMTIEYPNISMLWKSYLSNSHMNGSLEDQAITVLSQMKCREIKDLNKLEIIAIYCALYCG